jgi:hypothetical protein
LIQAACKDIDDVPIMSSSLGKIVVELTCQHILQ